MTGEVHPCVSEIARVHDFFTAWFAGDASRDMDEFTSTLATDFFIVSPDGVVRDRRAIIDLVASAFDTRSVQIRIENAVVRASVGGVILATYEEHQESAGSHTARQSMVAMMADTLAPHGWKWLAVSETWIKAGDRR